jgi:transposase
MIQAAAMSLADAGASRPCSRCGEQMKLLRTVPRFGPHPELGVFRCVACSEVETREIDAAENN